MNNLVYRKTMENLRKRIKIRVVKNSQDFIKYTSRPTCVNWKVFENNLPTIYEKKISLILFDTRLLFTDTDNLSYELHEKDPYKKMCKYKELFDLSIFSVSSK